MNIWTKKVIDFFSFLTAVKSVRFSKNWKSKQTVINTTSSVKRLADPWLLNRTTTTLLESPRVRLEPV